MRKKILVIDDEGIITSTIANLLKREEYSVEVATSGQSGIAKFKSMKFDLIITDIRMPIMDGFTTVAEIKDYAKGTKKSDVPVIFITGYADSEAHIKAEEFGKVIFKPFDMKDFLKAVADALRKE
jgi:CheY-like chemotaxis protein